MTNNEIPNVKELLEYKVKTHCELCDIKSLECCSVCLYTAIKQFIELFNRQKAEIKDLQDLMVKYNDDFAKQEAEIERLENAYKPVAWERDVFAEDMKQEIKKDCSYLMLDIKTIKAEAYKECIEKVKEKSNKMELVCSGALVRTDYTITDEEINNLLKELVGE